MEMKIENIIIHCSASTWGCVNAIREWHKNRGWRDIGYHFVILNSKPQAHLKLNSVDGSIEQGRSLDEVGAHTKGYNDKSIGICLIGLNGQFSNLQMVSLLRLLEDMLKLYELEPNAIIGHYETESGKAQGKTCPDFDIGIIRKSLEKGVK